MGYMRSTLLCQQPLIVFFELLKHRFNKQKSREINPCLFAAIEILYNYQTRLLLSLGFFQQFKKLV